MLVGLMGCGKSSIGKRLATRLGLPFVDADEEIERVARVFIGLGVNKLRLTGGEPLVRRDVERLIALLAPLGAELTLTTNASLLAAKAQALAAAGLDRITVSLDSLDDETRAKLEARLRNLRADLRGTRVSLGLVRSEARLSTIQLTVVTPGAFGAVAQPDDDPRTRTRASIPPTHRACPFPWRLNIAVIIKFPLMYVRICHFSRWLT